MNAGTLERLRTHVLPGVRGARTLLADLRVATFPSTVRTNTALGWREFEAARDLHNRAVALERDLLTLLHKARAERNAKVAKTRRTG